MAAFSWGKSFSMVDSQDAVDTPIDKRTVVANKAAISKLSVPYVGMLLHSKLEAQYFIITKLGPKLDKEGGPIEGTENQRAAAFMPLSEFLAISGGELGVVEGTEFDD